jgi:hypothetical protein
MNKISPLQRPSQIIIEEDEDFEDTSDSSDDEEKYNKQEIRKSALQFISKTATQEEIDNGFRVSETGESLFPDTNVDMSSYNEECNYTAPLCFIICLVIVTTIVVVSTI